MPKFGIWGQEWPISGPKWSKRPEICKVIWPIILHFSSFFSFGQPTKPTKPNLPNQTYQTKPTKPNLLVKAVNAWVYSAN